MQQITQINKEFALKIIERREPLGLFLLSEPNGTFTGIDNDSYDAFTENFPKREFAIRWLQGQFEV